MEIIIGKSAGFCYGVKRAVEGTYEEIKNNKDKETYCLGEIVHNKNVVSELGKKGIKFINDIEDARGKTIIRAHGVEKEIYDKANDIGIELKDLTCPKVLRIHEMIDKYVKEGYFIFLCGKKEHPETIGNYSYCRENSYIIEDKDDIENAIKEFEKRKMRKALLISQTTYNKDKFELVNKRIQNVENIELIVKNTICMATKIRQDETKKIASEVNAMIIIGGKNSSNTRELYNISKAICVRTYIIEDEKDLDLSLIKDTDRIGIMAGASTPEYSINKVVERLKKVKFKYADYPNWDKVLEKYYKNIYVEKEDFSGNISILKVIKAKNKITNKEGNTILDDNFKWLEFYPDNNKNVSMSACLNEKNEILDWYFDIALNTYITKEGVPYIEDLYLDISIDRRFDRIELLDEDELKEALDNKIISKSEFEMAYNVANTLIQRLNGKIENLEKFTMKYLELFE